MSHRYYDATIVECDRKEHGAQDGDCTCSFTLEWCPPHWSLPPKSAAKVPTGFFESDIGQLCFLGG